MATINGTANSAEDLFDTLINFVTANGWDIEEEATSTTTELVKGVQLKGTDLAGDGEIWVHLIFRSNSATDVHAIEIEGSAGYFPGHPLDFGYNPQNSYRDTGLSTSIIVRVPLHGNLIQYWLTGNPRRFMGAFRLGTRWAGMYCGYILPYGLPSQYPYPLWVAGCNVTTNNYTTNTNGCPWGASDVVSGMLYTPSGRWQSTPIAAGPASGRGYGIQMFPYKLSVMSNFLPYYYALEDKDGNRRYVIMKQIFFCPNTSEYGTFGEPDGLDYVTAWGASGGDYLIWEGKTYLLIQRESSSAANTAAAMLLE
jgi:hypothetical protein